MEPTRTFSKIVLALHMPESEVTRFLNWLGVFPLGVPRYTTNWRRVLKPDQNTLFTFGRPGLKRVKTDILIEQLIEAGYRYNGCIINLKFDTYTKKEFRMAHREGRLHIKQGDRKLDDQMQPYWKYCLKIFFEWAPTRPLDPKAVLLSAILQPLIWRRGRAFALWDKDGARSSLVELVGPKRSQPHTFTRLIFRPPGIFEDRPVYPL